MQLTGPPQKKACRSTRFHVGKHARRIWTSISRKGKVRQFQLKRQSDRYLARKTIFLIGFECKVSNVNGSAIRLSGSRIPTVNSSFAVPNQKF